jgi:hypothetical protein
MNLTRNETEYLLDGIRQAEKQQPIQYPQREQRRAWFIDLIRSIDPDTVTDIPTPGVTDEQDARNSREFPY